MIGFPFSGIIKRRPSYFHGSNCYPSDSALWCLHPKLILFIYFRSDGFSTTWSAGILVRWQSSISFYPIAAEPVQMGYGHLNWLCCYWYDWLSWCATERCLRTSLEIGVGHLPSSAAIWEKLFPSSRRTSIRIRSERVKCFIRTSNLLRASVQIGVS